MTVLLVKQNGFKEILSFYVKAPKWLRYCFGFLYQVEVTGNFIYRRTFSDLFSKVLAFCLRRNEFSICLQVTSCIS